MPPLTYEQLYDQQLKNEAEALDIRKNKEYRNLVKAIEGGRFDETASGSALMKLYFPPIEKKLKEYLLESEFKGHTGKVQRYISYLCSDSKVLAFIVLQTLIKLLAQRDNQVKISHLSSAIVSSLRVNQTYEVAKELRPKLVAYLGSEYKRASARRKNMLLEKHLADFKDYDSGSNKANDLKAGATLLDIIMNSGCDLIEKRKMFQRGRDRHSTLYISFTKEVFDILSSTYYIPPTSALYPPMLVKPRDWVDFKDGGLLTVKLPFMKIKRKTVLRLKGEDFSKAYAPINNLQSTSWRVNKRIHKVINHIYENNLIDPTSPTTLPNLYGGIPTSIPTNIETLIHRMEYKESYTKEEKKVWGQWNKKREQIQIGLDGEQGRRLQYLMSMGLADKMLNYDKFWYVYQLDYRGRVYPVTDFLTPQSKGYVKALLEFGEGEVLNEVGYYWFKVHSANTYGLDKELFPRRLEWFEEVKLKMLRAADDPMRNLSFWIEASSPFEFLSCCFAYQDYVQGLPIHIPIQLDAVNSGIQMYSGLLRDKVGARSTCVIGGLRSDLYGEVAARVEQKLANKQYPAYITFTDKEGKENVVSTQVEAKSMIGKFTRSMTKPNVMTVPYSVSLRGMTQQNWDLMDEMSLRGKDFWDGDAWVVNKLWTELTHDSIYEIVKGARAGQQYLKAVVGPLKEPALWHTPIYHLPVFQDMYVAKEVRIKTILGTLTLLELTDKTKRQKQLASVAANFIHSIDATILMYIAQYMEGSLGVIHDCFLVHPNEGEQVVSLYKKGFVTIMESDPLKEFGRELDPEGLIAIPYVGDLDLEEVYNSMYIIS